MKRETFVFLFGFFSLVAILVASILAILLGSDVSSPSNARGGSPSPSPRSPGSPIRVGYVPRFVSKQVLSSSAPNVTFNYVSNPLTDGSSGYLTYNTNSNMLMWPVKLPLNFTHARFGSDQKIFKFRRPNTSDTYGSFEDGSVPANLFMNTIDLGVMTTFFPG
jgi:hypothetical protein